MGNTDHTPADHENDQKDAGTNTPIVNPAQSAQSANSPNTREEDAHPVPITDDAGNSTTGKDSVEQDDEDVGGDQDRAPDPKIVPVVDKDDLS